MGRVKSLKRKVRGKNWYTGKDFYRSIPERILRPGKFCKSGHVSVVLEHGGQGKPVHQLVMLAFVGPAPEGMEVRHLNGNPTDNRLINLKYGTRRENILDYIYQGKRWRRLNIEDVIYIRFALFCGIKGSHIAKELGVSESVISAVKTRRTFGWV